MKRFFSIFEVLRIMQCKQDGCHFCGSESNQGYCSMCHLKNSIAVSIIIPKPVADSPLPLEKNVKPTPSKCWQCKRKVGLLGFQCPCEHTFCSKCRQAEHHSCTFNFYAQSKLKLEKENPKIIAAKLELLD